MGVWPSMTVLWRRRTLAWGVLLLAFYAGTLQAQELHAPPQKIGPLFDRLPVLDQGVVLVPLQPLAAWLALEVRQSRDAGPVSLFRPGDLNPLQSLAPGRLQARLSGSPYELPVAPRMIDDAFYVPLRFVVEALGFWVSVERRKVILELPQEDLRVEMAVPPDPLSHEAKLWRQLAIWYGLPPAALPPDTDTLPHWNLFARERQRELLAEIGPDVPTIIEAHWGGREVKGLRILSDAADPEGGAAAVEVLVQYGDGGLYEERFGFVLEPQGWRVRTQVSRQMGGGLRRVEDTGPLSSP